MDGHQQFHSHLVHQPPPIEHSGTPSKKPKTSKHKDGHRHKHKHKDKDKERSKSDHKVKKEPVMRKPLISESESEDDIPLALRKAQLKAAPAVSTLAHTAVKQEPADHIRSGPGANNVSRPQGVTATGPPPVAAAATGPAVKTEVKSERSDDDVPLAQRKAALAKIPEKKAGAGASKKPTEKKMNSKSSAVPVTPPAKPKAGAKRKKPESDDEEEDFKPKTKRTPTSASKTKGAAARKGAAAKKKAVSATASPMKDGRKKKEKEEEEVWKWWEEEPHPEGVKWLTLEHKGPYFAPPYEPLPPGVRFCYNGQAMELSPKAEEAAGFFAKMLDHEYTTKDVFCENFFTDWRKEMTAAEAAAIKDWSKCDFSQVHEYYKERSEERKAMSKEDKAKLKAENEAILAEYGWAIIDGHKQRIGNFKTEPPGLFRGRGDHPKQGKIKKRIEAEDVTINIGKGAAAPEPPPGHHWKAVQHDNKVTWLASWTENIQGQIKYVMLNPTSRLKGEKDWAKYETARKLKMHVDKIREQYQNDWKSKEMKARQRAVAVYFIDKLALRAGNEKDADETADTVGCCSLRVEHIRLHEELDGKEHVVEFDFLGKDSIRYYNRVPVERQVFKNLHRFVKDKKPSDDLFDRLTTTLLNKHLQELMAGLTAKVFRTFNASKTLQDQLDDLTEDDTTVPEKLLSYNRANRAVAILCNHQRAPPKTFDKQMENLQAKISAKEEAIVEARSELKALRKEARSTKDPKTTKKVETKQKQLARFEDQLQKLEIQATDKQENKEIALGTSKLNYLDPRITIGWCKKWAVPVEKIYNKSQREKFAWAIDMADESFEF